MKILLLDDDDKTKYLLDYYINIEDNWSYIEKKDFSFSNINDIDIVIVDFSQSKSEVFLDTILELRPDIKTITLSEELKSNTSLTCDDCIKTHNRRRLFKPVDPKVFYEQIKNFENSSCIFYEAFQNIENLLDIIIKRFSSLSYDDESNIISVQGNASSSYNTYQFLSVVNILDKNNISYTVIDDTKLQINL